MRFLVLLAMLAGCPTPVSGTIDLGLTTAPGSTLLDAVTKIRVTITNPRQTVEALRGDTGFSLVLDVEATGAAANLIVEGFDQNDNLTAVGQSPEFGVAAINARIVVYMGSPLGIARAPVSLSPARANVQADQLTYGVVFAGGNLGGPASDAIAVYNVYDHSLVGGLPMPAPRDGIALAASANGIVTLFGGADDTPTGTYWLFDSDFAPSGAYLEITDVPGFARANELMLPIGTNTDRYLVTGTPPLDVQGNSVTARTDIAGLAPRGASHLAPSGARTALLLDTTGRLVRFHDDILEPLALSRPDAAIAALPDGRFIVVGGGTTDEQNDIVVVDAAGNTSISADVLTTPRVGARAAATKRHIVVTGDPIEILDAGTLQSLATRDSIVGQPYALPNDQIMIVDATNGELSLFTPPPPAL